MPRRHLTETWLVLGVSLGSSAIYALLRIVDRLTRPEALSQQTAAMNTSVTPDRPWLDVTYQLVGIGLALVPVLLALTCCGATTRTSRTRWASTCDAPARTSGAERRSRRSSASGARALPRREGGRLNTTVAAANLVGAAWFTVPLLVLAAAQNAVLEETIMVGYLFRRWGQAGWGTCGSSSPPPSSAAATTCTRASAASSATSSWPALRLALHADEARDAARRRPHDPRRRRVRRLRARQAARLLALTRRAEG